MVGGMEAVGGGLVGKVVFSRGWCSVHGVHGVYSVGDNGYRL